MPAPAIAIAFPLRYTDGSACRTARGRARVQAIAETAAFLGTAMGIFLSFNATLTRD